MKKTKIVCTIGPLTGTEEALEKLIDAGMNVMRLNFSHGNYEEHLGRINNLKNVLKRTGKRVAVLLDTKGPEIRTIKLQDGKDVSLIAGQKFTLTTDKKVIGDSTKVAVTYDGLAKDLKPGDTVLIDDGLIEMTVEEIKGNEIRCVVINNGELGENKGVNLPNVSVNLPALSEKDLQDLKFGCEAQVDFIAASFIRKGDDVREVRACLNINGGKDIKIISKIENKEGLDNFEEILSLSDGIMVARGDLGVEIPVEDVPFAQKMMIQRCNEVGKVVITATQMLDSMIKNPRPTRAEVTDVANAIIDGTDAIMLSGETAKGKYPVEAVTVMSRIAEKTDELIPCVDAFGIGGETAVTEAVSKGVVDVSEAVDAKVIVAGTKSGRSARAIRKYFPNSEILAITNVEKTANHLVLTRGVTTVVVKGALSLNDFFQLAEEKAVELFGLKSGDRIIVTCGEEIFKEGTANTLKVVTIK